MDATMLKKNQKMRMENKLRLIDRIIIVFCLIVILITMTSMHSFNISTMGIILFVLFVIAFIVIYDPIVKRYSDGWYLEYLDRENNKWVAVKLF